MTYTIDRRKFLIQAAAGGLALGGLPALAQSSKGQVVVGNWGGGWNERTVKHVEAPFVEGAGIKVVRNLANEVALKTKLIAEMRLPRSSMDVVHMTEQDANYLEARGVWEHIDEELVPNLANVHPHLRSKFFVPWLYSGWVVMYNPNRIEETPTGFADLWNPKYAGRVGIMDGHYPWYMRTGALVGGGDSLDTELAKKNLLDLKKAVQPRIYPGHSQLAAALKSEEVWMACHFRPRVLQFAQDGVNVVPVFPKEGSILTVFGVSLVKKAPNRDNGLFYLNALLNPEGMAGIARDSFYAPSVSNAPLSPEWKERVEFTEEEQKNLHNTDFEKLTRLDPEWLEWWNRVFKA